MLKAKRGGYEIETRIGNPVLLHKRDTPYTADTCWWVFFRRRGRWTQKQLKGMRILRDLGMKIFKYPEEPPNVPVA